MKVEEFNRGHSLRFPGFSYGRLCKYVLQLPGVSFTRRRRFFWWSDSVGAQFTFGGHSFEIETDPWDGALWILPRGSGDHQDEFRKMREHFQKLGVNVECHTQPGVPPDDGLAAPSGDPGASGGPPSAS